MEASSYETRRAALVSELEAVKYQGLTFTKLEEEAALIFNQKFVEEARKSLPEDFYFSNVVKHKSAIKTTSLYNSLKKMPKGAVLHHHLASEIDIEWLAKKIENSPHIFEEVKELAGSKHPVLIFTEFPNEKHRKVIKGSLTEELWGKLSVRPEECEKAKDNEEMWSYALPKYFYGKFLVHSQEILKEHVMNICRRYIAEGAYRVETRYTPGRLLNSLLEFVDTRTEMEIFREVIKEIKQECPWFSICIIVEIIRRWENKEIISKMTQAYELKRLYPELIGGIDFSGDENKYRSFYELSNVILSTQEALCDKYGFRLPLILHCGESIKQSNENPIDGILLSPCRVGHGVNFIKFPYLFKMLKKQDICVEVNPISEQILKHVRDIRLNPAITYLNLGIPVTISGDDPTLYGTEGVTYDFFAAVLGFEWGIKELKLITLNSIRYSLISEDEKEKMKKRFENEWSKFIEYLTNGAM